MPKVSNPHGLGDNALAGIDRQPSRIAQMIRESEHINAQARARLSDSTKKSLEGGKVRVHIAASPDFPEGRWVEPMAAFPDGSLAYDDSLVLCRDGSNPVKPGWVVRWVHTVDHEDRETMTAVNQRMRFGYEVIYDPANNEPIMRGRLVAMQGPPEGVAQFMVAHAARPQSLVEKSSEDIAEAANRGFGKKTIQPFASTGVQERKEEGAFTIHDGA